MAQPISIKQLEDASLDAISLSEFIFKPAGIKVTRRLAPQINTLEFYLDYLKGLQAVYEQEDGVVSVNGVEVVPVKQAIKDSVDDILLGDYKTYLENKVDALPFEGGVLADTFVTVTAKYGGGSRKLADKNTDIVNALDFFTESELTAYRLDNTIDSTRPLQAAINSGFNIDLAGNSFSVNNLTQTKIRQAIFSSSGIAQLNKNANGTILTSTASYGFMMQNINWRGDSATPVFTGDGVVASGNSPQFINCGGRWISGRPLKATGSRVVIKGTCDIYQTTDDTGNGYDIEIGKSGTATLYHELDEVYTSQKQGGLLLIDTGSHTIKGGQFNKLSIKAGTKPSGINGGKTIGARILGDITVEQSSAVLANNQIDNVSITFAAGTSGCVLDKSNTLANGCTIVNNGNISNIIERNSATGADGLGKIRYGADLASRTISYNLSDATKAWQLDGSTVIPNGQGYRAFSNNGTTIYNIVQIATNDTISIGALAGIYTNIIGTNIALVTAGGSQVRISDGFLAPFETDVKTLGTTSLKWKSGHFSGGVGMFGTNPPSVKPTVTGSKGGNSALTSLITALANYGFIVDSTT